MAMAKISYNKANTVGEVREKPLRAGGSLEGQKNKDNKLGPKHPINNEVNHALLLDYIKKNLDFAEGPRSTYCNRLENIDKQLSGFLNLEPDDKARERDNRRQRGVKPVAQKLTLTLTQIDEAITFFMSIFAPEEDMFKAIAPADKQSIANGFALKLNMDADKKKYYRQYAKAFLNMMKYNLGGWIILWNETYGTKMSTDASGKRGFNRDVVWAGNEVLSIDLYNFLWDISVHPVDLAAKGEFFAVVEAHRRFKIEKMQEDGELFGIERFVNDGNSGSVWYRKKPAVRIDLATDSTGSAGGNTDWTSVMTAGSQDSTNIGTELCHYFGWLKGAKYGLSDDAHNQVWRITIANGKYICAALLLDNVHGMLPIAMASPVEDDLGMQQKSFAEILEPFSVFASSLMNIHTQGSRKALYGTMLYDPTVVDLQNVPEGEVAPRIPIKANGVDKDLGRHIKIISDGPNVSNTMPDLDNVIKLMQKFLPTDILRQVADLDRATTYQAAATVQGANRRMQKIARIIEDQGMKDVRYQMMWNIFHRMDKVEILDPKSGQRVEVDPAQFADANIEFSIAEGLKSIDRLMIISMFKETMNAIIQSQAAIQKVDLVAMLDYWTSLYGDKTDLNQFKNRDLLDTLDPATRQALSMLMQNHQLDGPIKQILQSMQAQQGQAGAAQ